MVVSGPEGQSDQAPQRWHSLRALREPSFRHLWAGIIVTGRMIAYSGLVPDWWIALELG